jgi:hypothetical protein
MIDARASVARIRSAPMSCPIKVISRFQVIPVAQASFKSTIHRHGRGGWHSRGDGCGREDTTGGVQDGDVVDRYITLETASTNTFEYNLNAKFTCCRAGP